MTSDSLGSEFDYKEYSLQQLDNWVNDALNNESLSSQELYDAILKTIDENVEYHKTQMKKGTDLLSLMKGNRIVDLMSDKEKEREYNRREVEYYNKRAVLDAKHSEHYYDYNRNDPNRENPFEPKTVTSGASCYDPKTGYKYSSDALFHIPDYTEL